MSNATIEPLPASYANEAAPAVPLGGWRHLHSLKHTRRGHTPTTERPMPRELNSALECDELLTVKSLETSNGIIRRVFPALFWNLDPARQWCCNAPPSRARQTISAQWTARGTSLATRKRRTTTMAEATTTTEPHRQASAALGPWAVNDGSIPPAPNVSRERKDGLATMPKAKRYGPTQDACGTTLPALLVAVAMQNAGSLARLHLLVDSKHATMIDRCVTGSKIRLCFLGSDCAISQKDRRIWVTAC